MMRWIAWCGLALWGVSGVWAQSNVSLARMSQDMLLMREQVGQLGLRVESLERQQAQLLNSYEALLRKQDDLNTTLTRFQTQLDAQPGREKALRQEIVTEVSKQIDALAKETQKAIDALAQAQASTPQISTPARNFDDSYPQTGVAHIVQPGETISGIARKYGSSIQDIMNANRIAKATALKAGETIFVPVKE